MKSPLTKPATPVAPAPEVDPVAEIAAIREKLAEWDAEDRVLLKRQLALEADGVIAAEPVQRQTAQSIAARRLNGHAPESIGRPSSAEQLWNIQLERAGIKIAVEMERKRENPVRARMAATWLMENTERWRLAVRETAVAMVALARANEARAQMLDELAGIAAEFIPLRGGRGDGLMSRNVADNEVAEQFLADAIAAGIITRAEARA